MLKSLLRRAAILPLALLLVIWWLNTPAGLLGKADAVGYAVCHRIEERSFSIDGRSTPLCARCSGMYLGAVTALIWQLRRGKAGSLPSWPVMLAMGGLTVWFGLDGLNSFLKLFPFVANVFEPNNTLRVITGGGMGMSLAVLVYPAFNQTAWQDWRPERPIRNLGEFALLWLAVQAVGALMLTNLAWLLTPLALISAAGVVTILTLVYSMIWLMILRRENSLQKPGDLVLPFIGGLTLALLQIALFDLGRFWLTGTWSGFTFG